MISRKVTLKNAQFFNTTQKIPHESFLPLPRNRQENEIIVISDVNDHVYSKSKSI